ncbi:MAG TPA: hypothetical protein VK694_06205 [Verrucomicrobiae bacterium]|nr:hypothetical protein [Verrucomicrobiae bacterium]
MAQIVYLHGDSDGDYELARERYEQACRVEGGLDRYQQPRVLSFYAMAELEEDLVGRAELAGKLSELGSFVVSYGRHGEFPLTGDAARIGAAARTLASGMSIGRHSAFATEYKQSTEVTQE